MERYSPGSVLRCLTVFLQCKVSPDASLNLYCFRFSSGVLHTATSWLRKLALFSDAEGLVFEQSQLCFKLNNPSSLCLSSQDKDFSPQTFWWPFAELGLVYPFLSCTKGPNTWHSIPVYIILHHGEWRVIIPAVSCSCYYSPGCFSCSLLPGCCCLMLLSSGAFSTEPLPMHQFPVSLQGPFPS